MNKLKHTWSPSIYHILVIVMIPAQLVRANGNCSLNLSQECICHTDQSHNVFVECIYDSSSLIEGLLQPTGTEIELHEVKISTSVAINLPTDFFNGIKSIYAIIMTNISLNAMPEAIAQVREVSVLDFSQNNIEVFNATLIQHFPKLISVNLKHNQIKDILGRESVTESSIENLDLSHNNLTSINSALRLWSSIKKLNLSFNKIIQIPNMNSLTLEILVMTQNSIEEVESSVFSGLPNLKTLDLSNNNISILQLNSLRGLENLQNLNISRNSLSSIPDGTFLSATQLKDIELSQNILETLSDDLFQGLEMTLATLSLAGNNIQYINTYTFNNLYNLQTLDLSQNRELDSIEDVILPPHVSSVDLSSCSLSHINECQFIQLIHLDVLTMNNNNFSCNCQIKWLYSWYTSKQIRNPSPGYKDENDWLCIDSMGLYVPINTSDSLQNCSLANPNHCYRNLISDLDFTHEIGLEISFKDDEIITEWKIYNNVTVYGFYVKVKTSDNDQITESPLIHKDARKFKFSMELVKSTEIIVCLQVLHSNGSVVHEVCQRKEIPSDIMHMLTGILAGIIFLLPCLTMLFYIIYKDRAYTKAELEYSQLMEEPDSNTRKPSKHEESRVGIAPITVNAKYVNPSFHLSDEHELVSVSPAMIVPVQINTKSLTPGVREKV